ncbi:CP100 protein, partial [Oxyruncus cristatus]|nr:CP100 protein [Oxyruncus cristatus]
NPFTIPSDADIFALRDKEIKKAREEHERKKTLKVHEKTTYSTKIKEKSGLRKALKKEEEEESRKQATSEERLKALQEVLSRKLAMQKDYALERETFHGYINDRREIFFLEYAMAVKRDEIKKMEDIAKNEEKKLEKAEKRMEKDAAMFEEFLKENQNNSVQALKMAKEETSAKRKKIMELQAITSQIKKVQGDISRIEDTLQEYKMYRDILYQLSPKEWQKEHGRKHTKDKDLKIESRANEGSASSAPRAEQEGNSTPHFCCGHTESWALLEQIQTPVGSHQVCQSVPVVHKSLTRFSVSYLFIKGLMHFEMFFFRSSLEDAENEISSDEDEEPELYFTHPEQLLITLMKMQDENISFIQNSQDIEERWNKVQHTFITTHESTLRRAEQPCVSEMPFPNTSSLFWPREKELAELKQQVKTLQSSVAREEEIVADLKLRVHLFSSGEHEANDQDKMLASLNKKVLEVYSRCTGDSETNLKTIEMLKVIEKQLNDLLDNLETIPPSQIEKAEKAIKKEKRARLREEKLKQKQQQDEGLKRDMERLQ